MHFLFFINEFSYLFSNEFALAGRSWGRRGASDSHIARQVPGGRQHQKGGTRSKISPTFLSKIFSNQSTLDKILILSYLSHLS